MSSGIVPRTKWHSVLVDLVILGIGGTVLLVLFTVVSPTRRGFYCEDNSIRYPFKESTIPNWLLYVYCSVIFFAIITGTEFVLHRRSGSSGAIFSRPLPLWLSCMYRNLVDFIFGCVASQLLTDVGKYSIGRLRPNFISVCEPNINLSNCSAFANKYITEYTCFNSEENVKDSRVSFPSGHASFSAYTFLYLAIYIQVKWDVSKKPYLRLIKSGIQVLLLLIPYFTALTRVMDNMHHWSDVSAGALIGTIAASLNAKYVSGILLPKRLAANKAVLPLLPSTQNLNVTPTRQSNFELEMTKFPTKHKNMIPTPPANLEIQSNYTNSINL